MSLMIYYLQGWSWYPEMACYVCQLRGPLNSSEEFPIKKQNVDLKFHASVESLPASL